MSHISIGGAVGSGFGLIGRKPLTVLGWGLVRIAFTAGILAVYAPTLLGVIPMMQAAQAAGPGAPSEAVSQQILAQMATLQGVGLIAQFAGLFLAAMLYCAVARAIVHPERGAYGYLRVSLAEVFVALLSYGASLAIGVAAALCSIPFVIVVIILAMNKMVAAAVIVGVLAFIALILVIILVMLRFAFVIPMTVEDGKFHLMESWTLTKGHTGALFTIGLLLMLIAFVAELLVGVVFVIIGFAGLSVSAGGLQNAQAFFNLPPMTVLARLGPWLAILALLAIPVEGCLMAIFMAPWSRAYRDVVSQGVASVFGEAPPPAAPTPPAPPPTPPVAPSAAPA